MPLPLILAGVAIAAGGYGVKKGFDAKEDMDRAEDLNRNAERLYKQSKTALESAHARAKSAMERTGKIKFTTYENLVIPFVDIFSTIKNIEFEQKDLDGNNINIDQSKMAEISQIAMGMKGLVQGGISAIGAGGLAGLAAYGSVGTLATASTGTAIGTLSGAAATNATLAWLGGGALSAGGMGVAGGTAVLGGIVAGPILAVGGMMMASKAEAALNDAKSNFEKAKLAAEEMKTATVATKAIRTRFAEVYKLIEELSVPFKENLDNLFMITRHNNDYSSFSPFEKEVAYKTFQLAVSMKNILEAPILNKDGSLNYETKKLISSTNI